MSNVSVTAEVVGGAEGTDKGSLAEVDAAAYEAIAEVVVAEARGDGEEVGMNELATGAEEKGVG